MYIQTKVTYILEPSAVSQISVLTAENISKLAFVQISEIYNPIMVDAPVECNIKSRVLTYMLTTVFLTMGFAVSKDYSILHALVTIFQ